MRGRCDPKWFDLSIDYLIIFIDLTMAAILDEEF